jgi:hypothetical protein
MIIWVPPAARSDNAALVHHRGEGPAQRLLAIFEIFGEWSARPDFEGCSFIKQGSIIAAAESDTHAAARARELGILLLNQHGIATQ